MALLFSKSGGEICELRILDLNTKKMLDDVLSPIWSEFAFEFTPDSKAITYTKMSTASKQRKPAKRNEVYAACDRY